MQSPMLQRRKSMTKETQLRKRVKLSLRVSKSFAYQPAYFRENARGGVLGRLPVVRAVVPLWIDPYKREYFRRMNRRLRYADVFEVESDLYAAPRLLERPPLEPRM